ncbi:MAG: asparagine synthase (glutamine-hydrolyzing) [Bryobacterales bacterium]|nr:asparagine synthase (glutamine-hydrolyzing) [Bryobacterales bacterium]
MCGIAGYWARGRADKEIAAKMAAAMPHRGPDNQGVWLDDESGVALAHRRLSILDVSEHGNQPMPSHTGRFWISFNGEIYNFQQVKKDLGDGVHYKSGSDTEVMLAAFERWGVIRATERFNGMFAFAVWDREQRILYLARDRFGEKPVYYQLSSDTLLFGSELKALRAHPAFDSTKDPMALAEYFRNAYIPAPLSIYKNTRKLPVASLLVVRSTPNGLTADVVPYWSAEKTAAEGQQNRFRGTYEDAANELETLLKGIVQSRMVSDVPLGAFLSGGVDSSMVVAMMQAASTQPVKTFTIGFHDQDFNEAGYAKDVAKHLGTDHTELYVGEKELLGVVPMLSHMYDEPFADSSQIPTYLVSKVARSRVTVSLSGDAGDEFFAGYTRYWDTLAKWARLQRSPKLAREAAIMATKVWAGTLSATGLEKLGRQLPTPVDKALNPSKIRHKGEVWAIDSFDRLYLELTTFWQGNPSPVIGFDALDDIPWKPLKYRPELDLRFMMLADTMTYLPDDILVKVDRATMAVSLESRAPFLDPDLFRFVWTLPEEWLTRNNKGKLILRDVLFRYVPRQLIERPKCGFAVPAARWLRQELRDWAEDLLSERSLKSSGMLNIPLIRTRWQEHLDERVDWSAGLWATLMFQDWLRT